MSEQPLTTLAVHRIEVHPDSRLHTLLDTYAAAKARADEASDQLKAVTDALKLEMSQAAPEGAGRIEVAPTAQTPGLRLAWTESWRLDSRRLKAEAPETYVRYAKKSGTWVLKATPTASVGDES